MRIEIERTGGFAGLTRTAAVDTAFLPPEKAALVHDAIAAARFFELPALLEGDAPGADRLHYQITVIGPERRHTVQVGESALRGPLRPLVDVVWAIARQGQGAPPDP